MLFFKHKLVINHKKQLATVSHDFINYPDTAFIFQTFNKSQNITRILKPFIGAKAKTIILFADGCVDSSATIAHRQLQGPNHFVIQSNDTHEIRNYRLGVILAKSLFCEYAVLLQDDDVYSDGILCWIMAARRAMDEDPLIAVIGGAGGANYDAGKCRVTDNKLTQVPFEAWHEDGNQGFRLGEYQSMSVSDAKPSIDGSSRAFVATVSRAPQIIRISSALELGFFPSHLEPFQYDDDYNCLMAWSKGHKILHMPTSCKTGNVGVGGMRLYNSVTRNSRPAHFCRNWNFVLEKFGKEINSGKIGRLVTAANKQRESSNLDVPVS
jgi:hypothetical protein